MVELLLEGPLVSSVEGNVVRLIVELRRKMDSSSVKNLQKSR